MAVLLFADMDYPVTDKHREYWSELGRFIHRFAMLEQQIHFMLRLYAETTEIIAQAVFSGVRGKPGLDLIKRLREVKALPDDPDFDRAVEQFGLINSVRDLIVHSGAILYGDEFLASNKNRTIPRQQKSTQVSAKGLANMTADLQTIFAAFFVRQVEANGADITAYATDFRKLSRAPWLYKPPAQGAKKHNAQDATLERAFQHSPSQGKSQKSKHQR